MDEAGRAALAIELATAPAPMPTDDPLDAHDEPDDGQVAPVVPLAPWALHLVP